MLTWRLRGLDGSDIHSPSTDYTKQKGASMRLLSIAETARRLGIGQETVTEWVRRSEDPLPSIPVGESGKFVRIIEGQIEPWLTRQAGGGLR